MANNSKKYASLATLQTFLDNLKATFSLLGHKHKISDLTDYTVDTTLSSTSSNPIANKTVDAEFEAIATSMNALDLAIDGKANASHNHDDRYFTETEINTKLASKSDTTHNHDSKYDAKGSSAAVQENLDTVGDALDNHTTNTDIHVTTTNKSNWNSAYTHSTSVHARTDATKVEDSTTNGNIKINGTETNVYSHPNSGVTAGTYKSVTVNAQGHITTGSNPTTLSGYGITDAETKTDANKKLTEAKSYADSAANAVKNDLLNNAGEAYDTLKELGDLIDDNKDAIDALETIAAGKADKSHTHTIANVTGLQSALDGKAATSHGTHVSYSTTAPVMDGTASVGTASTVARSDHKHPTDTSRASQSDLDALETVVSGKANSSHTHTIANITNLQSTLDGKASSSHTHNYAGSSSVGGAATSANKVNSSITIQLNGGSTEGTNKFTFDGSAAKSMNITPSGIGAAASSHTHDDRYYTESEIDSKVSTLNTAISGKAASSHTHSISNITNLQTTLDGKAASSHDHGTNYVATTSQTLNDTQKMNARNNISAAKSDHTHSAYATKASPVFTGSISMQRDTDTTVGNLSTALGYYNEASGSYSFAVGSNNVASGYASVAIGASNTASADGTFAGGIGCTASADKSFAFGKSLEAASDYQVVTGKNNVVDAEGKYVHIVGNGLGNGTYAKRNAHTLDWNGNAWFKGNVYVGGTSQDNATLLASVTTMTTAEYTALEEAEATNANTLYMLTDAEEEEDVLITTDDIDTICGVTV